MFKLLFTALLTLSATAVAEEICTHLLGTTPYAADLELTGWQSVYGTHGLLRVRGVREARASDGTLHYVFNQIDGPPRIFKLVDRHYANDGTRLKLLEIGDHSGLGLEILEVVVTSRQADGFRVDQWKFTSSGQKQDLNFYDPALERRVIAARGSAREKYERENPERGSREDFRKDIVEELRAEGLDPRRQMWIEEEVTRRRAQMLHDMFR